MFTKNLHYVGSFSTLQTSGANNLIDYGTKLSPKQKELYYRVLKGLKIYTPQELYAMNSNKKKQIAKVHSKALNILNLWKQEIMIAKTNKLIDPLFEQAQSLVGTEEVTSFVYEKHNRISCRKKISKPALPIAGILQALSTDITPDPSFICTLSFNELGIKKQDVINKLLQEKLLPSNYAEL